MLEEESPFSRVHWNSLQQGHWLLPPAFPRVSTLSNQESQNPDPKIYFKTSDPILATVLNYTQNFPITEHGRNHEN